MILNKVPKFLCILALWYAIVWFWEIPQYIMPQPHDILFELYKNYNLVLFHTLKTIVQVMVGLSISCIGGIIMGLLLYLRPIKLVISAFIIMQATPTFVLMPLFTIWFGYGNFAKLLAVFLSAFFPITMCLVQALQRTPKDWLEWVHAYTKFNITVLYNICWFNALPGLFSGLKLAAIYTPLTVLAIDYNGAHEGLGYLIMLAQSSLKIEMLFICLICVVLISLTLNSVVKKLECKIIFWPA